MVNILLPITYATSRRSHSTVRCNRSITWHGQQFQTTTPTARKDITSQRIGNIISILDYEIQLPTHASSPVSIIDHSALILQSVQDS
jgi:hypothetical protein